MEPEFKTNNQRSANWIWGLLLIGLGAIFLVNQFIPGLISGLLWAAAFAVGGVVLFAYYTQHKEHWWALIPAYAMWVVAALIVLGTTRFPGELIGAFVMFAIGVPFLYVYLRDRGNWWALIPAYVMGAIGLLILLTMVLRGELIGSYVMFAIAAPFLFVYLRDRRNWWALIPGGIMATIGVGLLVAGMAYIIPALMVIAGIYLLVRYLGVGRGEQAPAAPREVPKTGPEADRPLPEFEALGERGNGPQSGPEADKG